MRYVVWFALACLAAACGEDDNAGADAAAPDGSVVCADTADCDDAVFCNGVERCAPGESGADARGCAAATSPVCSGEQTCDEAAEACVTCEPLELDVDGDGAEAMRCGGADCDDEDPLRFPGAAETCDHQDRDEDCDPTTFGDRDGDGDGSVDHLCCNQDGAGDLACGADCDDGDPGAHPAEADSCDAVDNDCDGAVDEGVAVMLFPDGDGDMFGGRLGSIRGCPGTVGYVTVIADAFDCDDTDISVFPGATERCNDEDEDCDGQVDEGVRAMRYPDADGDSYGAAFGGGVVCTSEPGYSDTNTDCNDTSAAAHPGATETCDAIDNDCDTDIDENPGAACTGGVGACARAGTFACDGDCGAEPGDPVTAFQSAAAPNGSWDWNCDTTVEPDVAPVATSTIAAYCGNFLTQVGCEAAVTVILFPTTPPGPAPHCNAAWEHWDSTTFPRVCRWQFDDTCSGSGFVLLASGNVRCR